MQCVPASAQLCYCTGEPTNHNKSVYYFSKHFGYKHFKNLKFQFHRLARNYPKTMSIKIDRPGLFYCLLRFCCFICPSVDTNLQGFFILGPSAVNLHCLDLENIWSYLECGMKTTQEVVYNFAFVYRSKCHVCRSPSESNENVNLSEYLVSGPHFIRGESSRFWEEGYFIHQHSNSPTTPF